MASIFMLSWIILTRSMKLFSSSTIEAFEIPREASSASGFTTHGSLIVLGSQILWPR